MISFLRLLVPRHYREGEIIYEELQEISEITDDDGTKVKVITGEFWGKKGPVDGIAADPLYLDINVPASLRKSFKVDTYRNTFAYIFEGAGKSFGPCQQVPLLQWFQIYKCART